MEKAEQGEGDVLVFAPLGRDAPAIATLLSRAGLPARAVPGVAELLAAIGPVTAAVLIAEEGLFGQDIGPLRAAVGAQPPWSDLPFIVLTSHQEQTAVSAWRQNVVESLRNVSLLERPVHPMTLTSAVQAAVRARRRQFQIRDLLTARERFAGELEALVAERTEQLEEANRELRAQMAERARVEEALRQTQKIEAIGQLTGGIAHDFNNLLMVISGGLEMLDRQSDPARRLRILQGMRQAAQRGASLTRQLLAFSRKQALNPAPLDLALQIGGMRELLERSLRADVNFAFDFPEDLWLVEVDSGELELMLLNVAVNARDAMPGGGTITFRAENIRIPGTDGVVREFVQLSVTDTGTGMTDEVKRHVFEPFFTTKEVGRGSGLGLAQVHGFATQSGGSVRIESELDKGTSIIIQLPRSTKASPVSRSLPESPTLPEPVSGSILVVEDDDEVAALVCEMLTQLGYDVTRAASASAALGALANGRKVDIVFSDIMMPGGMNGIELAREIRGRYRDVPVLLTSGYAEAVKQKAETEGLRILRKPYGVQDLERALRETLGVAA